MRYAMLVSVCVRVAGGAREWTEPRVRTACVVMYSKYPARGGDITMKYWLGIPLGRFTFLKNNLVCLVVYKNSPSTKRKA